MKKLKVSAMLGLLLLASCSKSVDYYEPEPTPTPSPSTVEDPKQHAEGVLGFTIPSDQDWISTTKGTVKVNVTSSVKSVAIVSN